MRASPLSMRETRKQKQQATAKSSKTRVPHEWRDNSSEKLDVEIDTGSSSSEEDVREIPKGKKTANTTGKGTTSDQPAQLPRQILIRESTRVGNREGNATLTKPSKKGLSRGNITNEEIQVKNSAISTIFFSFILPILLVCLAVFAHYYFPEELRPEFLYKTNTDEKFNYPKIFENRLKKIRKQFPNQTERFWRILKFRSLAHLRNRKPNQPLVILLGAPPSAHNVVDCLAKNLAWCLDPEVSSSNFIDGGIYSEKEGHDTKKILDDRLKVIFERGVRSTLVMHLERLPPPSPLLFYKYCDNDEAPYKHAGIIFTVHLPNEPDAALSPVDAEGSIETYLSDIAWSKFPYESDSISALLSRIADTVALVSHESDKVIDSANCDIHL